MVQAEPTISDMALTQIVNSKDLQRPSRASHLENFVRAGRFDVVFFTKPHDDCFFHYVFAKEHGEVGADLEALACVNLAAEPRRTDHTPTWNAVRKGLGANAGNLFEIQQWSSTWQPAFFARPESFVPTTQLLGRGCFANKVANSSEDCTPNLNGHQCLIGALSLLARRIVETVYMAWGSRTLHQLPW